MKRSLVLFLCGTAGLHAAELPLARLIGPAFQAGVGFDSNPRGAGGDAATAVLGKEDNFTHTFGVGLGVALVPDSLKFTYAADATRFDRWTEEDFTTHRFGLDARTTSGAWTFTAGGTSLFIDGSRDTLPALAEVNANGLPLWRERRRQWQHRAQVQARAEYGAYVFRTGAKLLAYDYRTRVSPALVAFTDRSDVQTSVDLGWRQSADSLWLVGMRAGRQNQATTSLPGGGFDYSNDYVRAAAGWEGKPFTGTALVFAAGPDFRRHTGTIDPALMDDRNRVSLWYECGFTSRLAPNLTLTGKAARSAWLSSTGKAAYTDSCATTALAWTARPTLAMRFTTTLHRCDYYPVDRDDWELLMGPGLTWTATKRTVLTLDVFRHEGWDTLANTPGRGFTRTVVNLGATFTF